MISLVQHDKNIWKASDGTLELLYCKDTEYINATQLYFFVSKTHCLDKWLSSNHTLKLEYHLRGQLGDGCTTQFKIDTKNGSDIYIHPSLLPHLANWFGPKYNYPICKLLQKIMINTAMSKVMKVTHYKPALYTHSFIFFELDEDEDDCLQQFFAVECETSKCDKHIQTTTTIHSKA